LKVAKKNAKPENQPDTATPAPMGIVLDPIPVNKIPDEDVLHRILILRGLPCTGKTTWANLVANKFPTGWKIVNVQSFTNLTNDRELNAYLRYQVIKAVLEKLLAAKLNVIIDAADVGGKMFDGVAKVITELRPSLEGPVKLTEKLFHSQLHEIFERNSLLAQPYDQEYLVERWESASGDNFLLHQPRELVI
jgi:predicted kinase